jgi:hypothetical protein
MQRLQNSEGASEASLSPIIIESRTMFVYLLILCYTGPAHRQDLHEQLITSLLKPMEEHTEDAKNEEYQSRVPVSSPIYLDKTIDLTKDHKVKIAVRASLVANTCLAALQC